MNLARLRRLLAATNTTMWKSQADVDFIVAMHAALPDLLKIAEASQAYVAKVTAHDLDNEGIHNAWLELLAALGVPGSLVEPTPEET